MASGLEELQKVTTSTAEAKSSQGNIYDQVKTASRDGSINTGEIFGLGGIKYVGMHTDATSVQKMRDGVFNYVNEVNKAVNDLETKGSAANAFGPEVAKEVQKYVIEMKNAILAVTSNLNRFAEDIDEVAKAYRLKGQTVISDVQTVSGNISEAASANKYTYTEGGRAQ